MKLHGAPLSPYFEKVRLTLVLKGRENALDYPGVPGNALGTSELAAANPTARIPFLEFDDGTILPESQVICDFFERLYPHPPLRPADPRMAAHVDLLCRLVDIYVFQEAVELARLVAKVKPFTPDYYETCEAAFEKGLSELEAFFAPGTRAVGDGWTLADCTLLPLAFFRAVLFAGARKDLFAATPKLVAYFGTVQETDLGENCFHAMMASLMALRERDKARGEDWAQ